MMNMTITMHDADGNELVPGKVMPMLVMMMTMAMGSPLAMLSSYGKTCKYNNHNQYELSEVKPDQQSRQARGLPHAEQFSTLIPVSSAKS